MLTSLVPSSVACPAALVSVDCGTVTMTLYKYVSDCDVAATVAEGWIKFTPAAELNDPAEMLPAMRDEDVSRSLERLRQDGYSEEEYAALQAQYILLRRLDHPQAMPVPPREAASARLRRPAFEWNETLRADLEATMALLSRQAGVFSVSRRSDSLPMWSHYAAQAGGFLAEYEALDAEFQGDESRVLNRLAEVRYVDEPAGVTFDPRSTDDLFVQKFSDWRYEEELRVVLPVSEPPFLGSGARALEFATFEV